jgi:hypothetical protein
VNVEFNIERAARVSLDAYRVSTLTKHLLIRRVEQFCPIGELMAVAETDPAGKVAYVAFRGTDPPGNWVFTNFQAFFTPLAVIDDKLSGEARSLQGGSYRLPIPGAAHQGFSRAFSWLWYGTDLLLHIPGDNDAGKARHRIIRHTVVVAFLPVLWLLAVCLGWNFIPSEAPLLAAIILSCTLVGLERGTLEDLYRVPVQTEGTPLNELFETLNAHETVVFTGHSLGGALATIAFAVYRSRCKAKNVPDNASLITFGAPRVGDDELVRCFEQDHADRFIHVIHSGDPVPHMPPGTLFGVVQKGYWQRGWFGLLFVLLTPLWSLYARLYRLRKAGEWSSRHTRFVGDQKTLNLACHDMENAYLKGVATSNGSLVDPPHGQRSGP